MADEARVVERQFTADLAFEDGLELAVVDLAVRADGILEHFRGDRVLGVGQVDGAGGEVDAEGDQAGDDIEQQADGVEGDDGRIDATVDLAASLGVEQRTAGRQLAQQGCTENGTGNAGGKAHV